MMMTMPRGSDADRIYAAFKREIDGLSAGDDVIDRCAVHIVYEV